MNPTLFAISTIKVITYSSKSSSESMLLEGELDKPESSDENDWFNNDARRLITSCWLISMLTLRFLPISDIFMKKYLIYFTIFLCIFIFTG